MTDKTSKHIAAQLKAARLRKDYSQAQLAKKADMNSNYYAKIERAEIKPSVTTLEKIIKALGAKSSDIFPF
jgi:transcriptional regulator with XRE-family HTH domain